MSDRSFTITEEPNTREFTITQDGESRTFCIATGVGPKGPAGEDGGGSYTLPVATDTVLGGVLSGADVTIDETGLIHSTKYFLGNDLSGTVALDRVNGRIQTCSLTNDITLSIAGGIDGDELLLFINYEAPGKTVDFDSSIRPPVAIASDMPLILDGWNAYVLTFQFIGGAWSYVGSSPKLQESED